jgi:hypothetical protein
MKKFLWISFGLFMSSMTLAQSVPQPWKPAGADTTFPRSIIHKTEIAAVKQSLANGVNSNLYASVYASATSAPPTTNDDLDSKRKRSWIAKNAAFVYLLGVKPSGNTTIALTQQEADSLKSMSIQLLNTLNIYVRQFVSDSPANYIDWQWSSKQIIDYLTAYDLLKGAGVSDAELAAAKIRLRNFIGNLYYQATRKNLGVDFFQGAKNNHALMSAAAIGMGAVILNDLNDTDFYYRPLNWINAAMWNIHNVMWWDIRKQSMPGAFSGYAEGTYYMRYAFINMLPFFYSIGKFLPDVTINYIYNGINRKLRNPWYDTNYTRIYDWMAAIRLPDGRLPAIEDSYTFSAFPELAMLRKPKYVWPFYSSQLDVTQYNSLESQLDIVTDYKANYIAANITPVNIPDSLYIIMPDAGIAVFRNGWDSSSTYFALTGKHGVALESSEAHNHADDGNFLMMVNGQNMALDPGYLNYEMRDSVSKAQSHNMLLVDGVATTQGFPGKSNGAEAYIEKCFQSAVQNYAELRTSYQGTDVNRKVLHVRNSYFLLIDHLQSNAPHQYRWQLHGYGLQGGNASEGTYNGYTQANRATWKRNNSGLFATVISDKPASFFTKIGMHEFTYATIQNHTALNYETSPTNGASFISCLQGFKNLQTDTIPVNYQGYSDGVGYTFFDGTYRDLALTKSTTNTILVTKATSQLANDYSTDAQFFWISEKNGQVQDLFVYKATFLKKDNKTLFSATSPKNIQYLQTGPKSYKGYCGDTGLVSFYTGEYIYRPKSDSIVSYTYDSINKIGNIRFGGSGYFNFTLDDTKMAIEEAEHQNEYFKVFPNPASQEVYILPHITTSARYQLVLMDAFGKTIIKNEIPAGTSNYALSLNEVPAGCYFMQLVSSNSSQTRTYKLVVVK